MKHLAPLPRFRSAFVSALLVFLALSPGIRAQQSSEERDVSVHVHGVPNDKGSISVALYAAKEDFLKFDRVFRSASSPAQPGIVEVLLPGVPAGEYAVALFHDENGNEELDTNWLGVPKEKVAFSKAKMRAFGPPRYRDCRFEVSDEDVVLDIRID